MQTSWDNVIKRNSCWNRQLTHRLVGNCIGAVGLLPEGSRAGQETAAEDSGVNGPVLHKPLTGDSRILTDTHGVILKHCLYKQVHGYHVKVLKGAFFPSSKTSLVLLTRGNAPGRTH